jgi:hypothetical protein
MLAWSSQCRTVRVVGALVTLPCPCLALSVANAVCLRLWGVVLALVIFAAAIPASMCATTLWLKANQRPV